MWVMAALWGISDSRHFQLMGRRKHALERIRSWAETTSEVCERATKHRDIDLRKNELKLLLRPGIAKMASAQVDAQSLGREYSELLIRVVLANREIMRFDAMLGTDEDIARLRNLYPYQDFGDMKPISNTKELEEAKEKLLQGMLAVIESTTANV